MGFRLLSQVSPSSSILSFLLPVFNFRLFFIYSMTRSCHRCLDLPTCLLPIVLQSDSFLFGLARSIRWICPSYLILCALLNLTIPAPSINLPISMLFHILHILSILQGPNIFLSISLPWNRHNNNNFELKTCCERRVRNQAQRNHSCHCDCCDEEKMILLTNNWWPVSLIPKWKTSASLIHPVHCTYEQCVLCRTVESTQ